jgi:hypothetical protein
MSPKSCSAAQRTSKIASMFYKTTLTRIILLEVFLCNYNQGIKNIWSIYFFVEPSLFITIIGTLRNFFQQLKTIQYTEIF